jgi:hypothetical protein
MNGKYMRIGFIILSSIIVLLLAGCQTAYYKTMEKFGYHKRDILVDRVKDAKETQEEAKEQFKSALESDVASLVREMEASINEADAFIQSMAK